MLRIGINGFGRIGRSLLRVNMINNDFDVVLINDIDPSIENHAYLLEFDSIYGRINDDCINCNENGLTLNGKFIKFTSHEKTIDVPWHELNVDIVIDATGLMTNVLQSRKLIEYGKVKKVIVTFSPDEGVDSTLIVGVNEEIYDKSTHHIISSSICDANAVGPFYKVIDSEFGVELGEITTLHPWLSYQNLLDGTVKSVSNAGHFWNDFALGRSSVNSMIPKETSLVSALDHVIPNSSEKIHASSFRTPTPIVSIAEGVFLLKKSTNIEAIREAIFKYMSNYPEVIDSEEKSLVSLDFVRRKFGVTVDMRWLHLNNCKLLKFVLWYDNEFGYSSRTLDLAKILL